MARHSHKWSGTESNPSGTAKALDTEEGSPGTGKANGDPKIGIMSSGDRKAKDTNISRGEMLRRDRRPMSQHNLPSPGTKEQASLRPARHRVSANSFGKGSVPEEALACGVTTSKDLQSHSGGILERVRSKATTTDAIHDCNTGSHRLHE